MQKKIMKVIESCTDCEFSKEYQGTVGNTSFVLVCNYEKDDGEKIEKNPFLIAQSRNKIKNYDAPEIPNNCPLEDYHRF